MTIVQIGANKGYDDVTEIANQNSPNRMILVEPFHEHNESLIECYKHIPELYIENIAIIDNIDSNTSIIHYHESDSIGENKFELASLNINHFFKIREHIYTEEGMRKRIVPSFTINQLFNKYQLIDIDILFIDTEGFDDKIIKSIDFNKYNIKEIYYENLHIDTFEIQKFLEEKNYTIEKNVGVIFKWNDKATKIKNIK